MMNTDGLNHTHREGPVAKNIEHFTAKLPSDVFLWAALGSIAGSITAFALNQRHLSLLVGQWVPTFLLFGVYNKIVKELGHDASDRSGSRSPGGIKSF